MTERYTLLTELGRGGMGVVWKARDEETGRIVALKRLRDTYAEDADYLKRFERELELAKRIHSRHVIEVLEYGVRDGTPYLALEFVDGRTLRENIASHGPYTWTDTRALLTQLAQGLADAHAAGVIHRDLKPSNVLIGQDGVAKIADFGIARGLDLSRVTGTATLLGTPAYLAPEGPADERSDLYSLGVIAFEMLTGVVPFEGRTYQEVILRHVREAPDLARLPAEARLVVGWLLAKDPDARPQRASDLLAVLWGGAQAPELKEIAPAPLPPTTVVSRPAVPAPDASPAQVAQTVVIPAQTLVIRQEAAGPVAPPRAAANRAQSWAPTPPVTRRSSTPILVGLGAVGLVACLVAVAIAGGFLRGADSSTASAPIYAVGASATATVTVKLTPTPPPTPVPGFRSTGSMATARWYDTATLLRDGRVLVAGGNGGTGSTGSQASAELYDPATGTFSPTGSMKAARDGQTATLLSDGRVLIAGGRALGTASRPPGALGYEALAKVRPRGLQPAVPLFATTGVSLASAELYDPKSGTFSPTGSMGTARAWQTATLLRDGRVLVAGGNGGTGSTGSQASAELYDPKTGTFSPTGSMTTARSEHTATLLSDGRVLIAGGMDASQNGLASAEPYDPTSGTFSPTGSMTTARSEHTATLLSDGRVLIAGGMDGGSSSLASAELYDPKSGTFSPTGSMGTAYAQQTATLLSDGRVLIAGGYDGSSYLATAQIYTP